MSDRHKFIDSGTLVPVQFEDEYSEYKPLFRQPLTPVLIANDSEWRDAISYAIYVTIYAEVLDIDQCNITDIRENSQDPRIKALLHDSREIAQDLGLQEDFAYQIISQVGNYKDIFDRNFCEGKDSDLPESNCYYPRSQLNRPWTEGGLLYAPPFK